MVFLIDNGTYVCYHPFFVLCLARINILEAYRVIEANKEIKNNPVFVSHSLV